MAAGSQAESQRLSHISRAERPFELVRRQQHAGRDAVHGHSRHPVRNDGRVHAHPSGGPGGEDSNPGKVFFPELGVTKLDLVEYYLELADATLNHLRNRPTVLKRFVNGAAQEPFFQKRVPETAPDWIQTATISFPSGRTARELLPNDAAHLVWGVNLGVIDWNPWPVRDPDLDHPDELRVDLDPTPEASFDDVRQVALCAGEVLREHNLTGFPKTSGSRGIHINVRIEPEHDFKVVRRCALALAREVERRVPELATSKWWKEERMASSSTTTRTRATVPSRPRTASARRLTRVSRPRSMVMRLRTSSRPSCESTLFRRG